MNNTKKIAYLEYLFMFEPDSTWNNLYSFEKDLADFFAAHGLEANVIKMIEGHSGRRVMYISRIDPLSAETNMHNKVPTMKDMAKLPKFKGVASTAKKLVKGVVS